MHRFNVLSLSSFPQQLFRSQAQGATPQQLQLLQQQQQQQQQQQYLAASQAQQQQQQVAAVQQQQSQNFQAAPYTVIGGQEPYLITGAPQVVQPYYMGGAPWVYPAGLLPGAPPQAAAPPPPRRPLTPSSAAAAAVAQDTANNLAQTVCIQNVKDSFFWFILSFLSFLVFKLNWQLQRALGAIETVNYYSLDRTTRFLVVHFISFFFLSSVYNNT